MFFVGAVERLNLRFTVWVNITTTATNSKHTHRHTAAFQAVSQLTTPSRKQIAQSMVGNHYHQNSQNHHHLSATLFSFFPLVVKKKNEKN